MARLVAVEEYLGGNGCDSEFPIAESANSEDLAAVILAKVSGREVPTATSVIAVTASLNPIVHPSTVATSATTAVTEPIKQRATTNAGQP